MKKKFLYVMALAAMVSCSSDEFVGDGASPNTGAGVQRPISFGGATSSSVTRADKTGGAAATLLNNNFVVFGYKTPTTGPVQTVFDNYQVNYVADTEHTTESNSAGWEYVSYKNLPFGTTTTSGGTLNTDGVSDNATASTTNVEQSIKYWDFSADKYDFFAYSLGTGSSSSYAKASALNNTGYGGEGTAPGYTLEGTAAQLGACYISKKNSFAPSTSKTEVDLEFRSFLAKVQLGFYEIIPGYSVKEVKFYPSSAGASSTTPSLYAASAVLPNGGKYTITFDSDGNPQLALAADPTPTKISKIDFSTTLTNYAATVDYKEASANYLGRSSNVATLTDIINVLPNPDNTNALNLKMDFTLVSRDGTGETINMTGATAVIPAAYAKWKPNYKYTYIFKISDNTNAQTGTGVGAITGLYPITLDAIVADAQDGTQETITTVDDPSITTYAKGTMVTANNEYLTGANIYIVVDNGTALEAETGAINAKLYTATITLESAVTPRPAAQGITEETVANALAQGGSVVDANGATLAVTEVSPLALSNISTIAAADAPDGKAITVAGVMFTPASAGNYVFEYTDGSNNKHYKVIKVVAAP